MVLHVYRCVRCSAVYALDDDEFLDDRTREMLQNSPCRACGKGGIERCGKMEVE